MAILESLPLDQSDQISAEIFTPNTFPSQAFEQSRIIREVQTERPHELVECWTGGKRSVFWWSEPTQGTPCLTIMKHSGFGEIVETGIGKKFHFALADSLPQARVISVATLGFGPEAEKKSWSQVGIRKQATQSLEILDQLPDEGSILLVGTSMGTIVDGVMVQENAKRQKPLPIIGMVNYDSAVVTPDRVLSDVIYRFTTGFPLDAIEEVLLHTKLSDIPDTCADLLDSIPKLKDIPSLARYVFDILWGVPEASTRKVLGSCAVAVISGTKDPLFQLAKWTKRQQEHSNLSLHPVRGRGHAMALHPTEAANKVAKTIRQRVWYPQDTADGSSLLPTEA